MYQSQQPGGQSFRLGDHAGQQGAGPGDYIVRITGLELTASKEGNPRIKVAAAIVAGPKAGQQHFWGYSLVPQSLWALSNDLITMGLDPTFEFPHPTDPRFLTVISPMVTNRAFQVKVTPQAGTDYTNTKVIGPVQLDPAGNPVGFGPAPGVSGVPSGYQQPAPTGPPAGWPPPTAQGTPTSPTGPGYGQPAANVPQGGNPPGAGFPPPMNPGGPQPSPYAPPAQPYGAPPPVQPQGYQQPGQPAPTGYTNVDPASLFRTQ